MSYSNGFIVPPIDVEEISDLLGLTEAEAVAYGTSRLDVGFLCSNLHNRVNKFSRYKPVLRSKLTELTDGDFKLTHYGFTKPQFLLVENIAWSYTPAKGGDQSPYRITDFNGYNHRSVPMFEADFPAELTSNTHQEVTFMFDESCSRTGDQHYQTNSIKLFELFTDIDGLDYYPSVVVWNKTTNYARYISTDRTLANLNQFDDKELFIKIHKDHLSEGNKAIVFCTLAKYPSVDGARAFVAMEHMSLAVNPGVDRSSEYTVTKKMYSNSVKIASENNINYDKIDSHRVWLNYARFIVENNNSIHIDCQFRVFYSVYMANSIIDRIEIGALSVQLDSYSSTQRTIGFTNAPIVIQIPGNEPYPEEVEIDLEIWATIDRETRILWSDLICPFG